MDEGFDLTIERNILDLDEHPIIQNKITSSELETRSSNDC